MKRARVVHNGIVHSAMDRDGQLLLEDGSRVWPDQVTWLPPLWSMALFSSSVSGPPHSSTAMSCCRKPSFCRMTV